MKAFLSSLVVFFLMSSHSYAFQNRITVEITGLITKSLKQKEVLTLGSFAISCDHPDAQQQFCDQERGCTGTYYELTKGNAVLINNTLVSCN